MQKLPYVFLLLAVSMLLLWTATGTLAPYALSHHTPHVCGPCRYLCNLDHSHFSMTFSFLDGAPREQWADSVYLRRILYPLLAYPLMKLWGFDVGGLVTSCLVWGVTFLAFARFLFNRYGQAVSLIAAGLLATYPGQAYWFGLPYAHSILVSSVLVAFMLLVKIGEAKTAWRRAAVAFFMGIPFLAYDLLPFFACATLLMLLWQRQFVSVPLALFGAVFPTVLSAMVLQSVYDVPFTNSNSASFTTIIKSYLDVHAWHTWWPLAQKMPAILWHNFKYSNFLFLPYAFLAALCLGLLWKRNPLTAAEGALALSILLVFLCNNLAPQYEGWQMRGEWIARIYQPLFVVMIVYISRLYPVFTGAIRAGYLAGIFTLFLLNGITIAAPYLGLRWSDGLYYNFYRHSVEDAIPKNIALHGARPVGFCDP